MKKTIFKTESVNLREEESNQVVSFSNLLSLCLDEDQSNKLLKRFNPDGEEFYIQIGKIDIAYKYAKKWVNKFEYQNAEFTGSQIQSYFIAVPDDILDGEIKDMIFVIPEIVADSGKKYSNVHCRAIYSAKDQFYEDLKLTTHVNFLKNNGYNAELKKLNNIWIGSKEYEKQRKYKLIKSKEDHWFVRSINSPGFKEYGTAFTFVYTILLLNEIQKRDKGIEFTIETLDLNESKISMILSQGKGTDIEEVGLLKSSISMVNNDLGKGSFKLTKNITLIPRVKNGHSFSFDVPRKMNVNETRISVDHKANIKTLNDKFSGISDDFWSTDTFVKDYYSILKSKKAEGVRSSIEQKIIASPILNKENTLKSLFKPNQSGVIDNLAKLIDLCGQADALDIDYDLKSKLREIIAEVLFTKK